jgi:predicted cupin superfamily sugar epimerase
MDARAAHLIASLSLTPHPEGGYFREVYRSASRVQTTDGRGERAAVTTIDFLLVEGQVSRWHRVASDEAWHYYEGASLELLTADERFETIERIRVGAVGPVGPVDDDRQAVHVVPARRWQAARSLGAYTLVGCTVAPGFDFADFEMLDPRSREADTIRRSHSDAALFI